MAWEGSKGNDVFLLESRCASRMTTLYHTGSVLYCRSCAITDEQKQVTEIHFDVLCKISMTYHSRTRRATRKRVGIWDLSEYAAISKITRSSSRGRCGVAFDITLASDIVL